MDKNRKILIGVLAGVVALCMLFGIVGATFRAGMMMGGRNNTFAYAPRTVPQAVPPAAPQDDVLPAPSQTQRQKGGRGFDQDNNGYGQQFNQRGGFGGGFFGFIGGIFRFIFTVLLIGFIFFAVRMFFKRGGPGRWGWGGPNGGRGMPPFFEEWHKRAHEPHAAPQPAPASDAPAAATPAENEASVTAAKPDDKPQDAQAI